MEFGVNRQIRNAVRVAVFNEEERMDAVTVHKYKGYLIREETHSRRQYSEMRFGGGFETQIQRAMIGR